MAYVLMKNGWEYNDEVYYRSTGGTPQKLYSDLDEAQEAVDQLNLKELKSISKYFVDYVGYEMPSKLADFLESKGLPTDDWRLDISSLSDEDIIKAGKLGNVSFYEIIEIEEASD